MRSIIVATVIAAVLGLQGQVTAQTKSTTFPMEVKGTPGVKVMAFLNNGKVGEATLGPDGLLSAIIDVSNLGKVKLTTYVDVCQDGQMVKVMVASGTPAPEDEGCKRRIIGAPFFSDCGVTRLGVDIMKMKSQAIGCSAGISMTKLGVIGGAIVTGAGIAVAGAGGDSTAPVGTPAPPPVGQNATTNVASNPNPPVAAPAPPTQDPSTPAPAPPATVNGNYAVTSCSVERDATPPHDPTLGFCRGMNGTATAQQGSLTIRHPAPFIDVTGPNYDTTSGAFDISGTGSIAGFNNVSARAVGTVNNQAGRITFSYTLGANGVFPGGQPITYSITLQKR